eukprot:SM000171S03225  [mRNA]  locus=s171:46669:49653:- [translate_table: standard]
MHAPACARLVDGGAAAAAAAGGATAAAARPTATRTALPPAIKLPGTALQARPRCWSPRETAVLAVGRLAATPAAFAVSTAAVAAAAAAASGGVDGANAASAKYEFLDEHGEVEVRVRLPADTARCRVAVDTQDDSLIVAAAPPADGGGGDGAGSASAQGFPLPLLVARPLYDRVLPAETVWLRAAGDSSQRVVHPGCFVARLRFLDEDEGEVVVSLRKVQPGKPWPALVQEWAALVRGMGRTLAGTSIYIVGADSAASWAVACELAGGLQLSPLGLHLHLSRYVPLRTEELVEQAAGVPANHGTLLSHSAKSGSPCACHAVAAEEGAAELARMEGAILEGLTSHVRCVVATMGGERGAASSTGGWRHLQAGICVHLDCSSAVGDGTQLGKVGVQSGAASLYSRADVSVAVQGGWHDEGGARLAAEAVLKAIKGLADSDADLIGKKSLYVRLGCRGDWPNLMPPGWRAAGDGSGLPTAQLAPCRSGTGPVVGETEAVKAPDAVLVDGSIA